MLLSQRWREGVERYRQQDCEWYRNEEMKRRITDFFTALHSKDPQKGNSIVGAHCGHQLLVKFF